MYNLKSFKVCCDVYRKKKLEVSERIELILNVNNINSVDKVVHEYFTAEDTVGYEIISIVPSE